MSYDMLAACCTTTGSNNKPITGLGVGLRAQFALGLLRGRKDLGIAMFLITRASSQECEGLLALLKLFTGPCFLSNNIFGGLVVPFSGFFGAFSGPIQKPFPGPFWAFCICVAVPQLFSSRCSYL